MSSVLVRVFLRKMQGTWYSMDLCCKGPDFSDSRDLIFSDSRDPTFNSRDSNQVPKTP